MNKNKFLMLLATFAAVVILSASDDSEHVKPVVIKSYIHPAEIKPGQEVTIAWRIVGAGKVSIEPGIGEVNPRQGEIKVKPQKSITYTITAHGSSGAYTEKLYVHISDTPPFKKESLKMNIQYIDHWNLRYLVPENINPVYNIEYGVNSMIMKEEFTLEEQLRQIKQNMDVAKEWGASSYLLFAREEVFESFLEYNFSVGEIKNLGQHLGIKPDLRYRKALMEIITYAHKLGLELYYHTNQFYSSEKIIEIIGELNPKNELMWEVYEKKMREFIRLFPGLAGVQITCDETMMDMTSAVDANRIANVTARAIGTNRKVLMRTWQRIDGLGDPKTMFDNVLPNVWVSLKNTDGDFKYINPYDHKFIAVADPRRQLVEFDAWREYGGHNVFPFYFGDYWSPRVRNMYHKGIRNIAVRMNWNSGNNQITSRKWGNWVNIFVLTGLAQNPDANPDDLLMQYVKRYYPAGSYQAVFNVYKHSTVYMSNLFYPDKTEISDHSQLPRKKKIKNHVMNDESLLFIDEQEKIMQEKIAAIPDNVEYKAELKKAASAAANAARGIAMCRGDKKDSVFMKKWYMSDPNSFFEFRGNRIINEN